MLLRTCALGVCSGIFAASIVAEPQTPNDPMAQAYGNTIVIAIPDTGYSVRRYIDADHTYRDVSDSGVAKGIWSIEGGQVCYTQTLPKTFGTAESFCNPLVARAVGESWSNTDPGSGAEVQISLIAGRQ